MEARELADPGRPDASSSDGFGGLLLVRVSLYVESDARARVVVEGDIDRDTAPLLRAHLLAALAYRPVLCCDLRRIGFFGAAGVHMLVEVARHAAATDQTFEVSGAGESVRTVLRLTGVDGLIGMER